LTDGESNTALENARRIADLQSSLGVAVEGGLQQLLSAPTAFVAANLYYLIHFPLTVIVLVAAFLGDRHHTYVAMRDGMIGVTGLALFVHLLLPLAPPRMLPGIIDTGAAYGPDPYSLPGSDGANQFAAMPSLHVAWAVFVGVAVWRLSRRRAFRFAAIAHPLVTAFVVIVTGHHFVIDVFVGAVLSGIAVLAIKPNRRSAPLSTLDSLRRGTKVDQVGVPASATTPAGVSGFPRRSAAGTASSHREESGIRPAQ
jgi:membrane-associated phospholipid phosphatase